MKQKCQLITGKDGAGKYMQLDALNQGEGQSQDMLCIVRCIENPIEWNTHFQQFGV